MYIHAYGNSPTSGLTDGTLVSEGTHLAPITTATLDATAQTVGTPIKMALRVDAGYKTSGNTVLSLSGTNASDWQLAPDNAGSPGTFQGWGSGLTISASVAQANVIFWAQARAVSSDVPLNDATVSLNIGALIVSQ